MLARVRILGDARTGQPHPAAAPLAVPAAALRDRAGDRARAWSVDTEGRLRLHEVIIAGEERGGWVPVAAGALALGDPLVLGMVDGLQVGRRVRASFAEGF